VSLRSADFFARVVGHEEDHPDQPDQREWKQHDEERSFDHSHVPFRLRTWLLLIRDVAEAVLEAVGAMRGLLVGQR
jgi:hypothetical protein